jgi:uncharacterized RDD family membrane protein YckC
MQNVSGLLSFLYFPLLWSRRAGGATLGMRLFSLRVVDEKGSSIGLLRAFARFLGLLLSFLVLYLGVLWVAFDPEKQGWHDKMAHTYIVHV